MIDLPSRIIADPSANASADPADVIGQAKNRERLIGNCVPGLRAAQSRLRFRERRISG
jgi:hypothetical protein